MGITRGASLRFRFMYTLPGYDDDDDADGDDCDYAIRPMEVFALPQSYISANKQVRHNSL